MKALKSIAWRSNEHRQEALAQQFFAEPMEPRILLSADALGLDAGGQEDGLAEQLRLELATPANWSMAAASLLPPPSSLPTAQAEDITPCDCDEELAGLPLAEELATDPPRNEIIFVDKGVENSQQLIDDIVKQKDNVFTQIYLIDSDQDGVGQITRALGAHTEIDAVHILSHGKDGQLYLGNGVLSTDSLKHYEAELGQWQDALTTNADILLYGCDVASSQVGETFLTQLGELTQADIAASSDMTGTRILGANWTLEYQQGQVELDYALSQEAGADWFGSLAKTHILEQNVSTASNLLFLDQNWGQSFTHTSGAGTYEVDQISIMLNGTNDVANAFITVALHDNWNDLPLRFSTVIVDQADTTPAFYTFDFSSVTLTDGEEYFIRASNLSSSAGNGAVAISFEDGSGGALIGGDMINHAGNPEAGKDLAFRVSIEANTAPTATDLSSTSAYNEGDASVAITDIVVSDVDSAETITATLTLANTATGSLSANDGASYTPGTGVWTLTDSVANVNTALANLVFNPNTNNDINTTIGVVIDDGDEDSSGPLTGTINLNVTAANDAPTATNLSSTSAYTEGDASVAITDIVVSDVDSAETITATLTLVNTATGSLSANDGASYTPGTGVWTLTDSVANVNTALANLVFNPALNNDLDTTIAVVIDDGDEDASGPLTGTITLDVTAVNEALLLSTTGNVSSPSGSPGLDAWNDSTVFGFDPDPAGFEPTTSGQFSAVFDIATFTDDTDVDAIHFVTQNTSVGTGTAINLLAGDVLLSLASNETLTSNNVLAVTRNDVFFFRPDTPGNYSSGTFSLLLSNPNNKNISGITLVEESVVVGDTTLQEGSFLLGQSGAGADDFAIHLFTPGDLSASPSNGSLSVLVDGKEEITPGKDIFQEEIIGLELVENDYSLGGSLLQAGTILLTLDGDNGVFADNTVIGLRQDIYSLNLSQTTLVSGSTAGSVALLFEGLDVGLAGNTESLDALSLVEVQGSANNLPTGSVGITGSAIEDQVLNADTTLLADADGLGAFSFQWQRDGLTISAATAGNYTLGDADVGSVISVVVSYTDGGGNLEVVTSSDTAVVTNINDAPTATNLSSTSAYNEGDASVAITDIVVSDVDSAETVTATLTLANTATGSLSANDGASYTPGTGVWTLTSSVANVNTALANLVFNPNTNNDINTTIGVVIDDGDEDSSGPLTGTINLNVTPVDDAPVLAIPIPDQVATEDSPFFFQFAANSFTEVDSGDSLSFSAVLNGGTALPAWLTFDPATRSFSGTPVQSDTGTITIVLTATDVALNSTSDSFNLAINAVDEVPTMINNQLNLSAGESVVLSPLLLSATDEEQADASLVFIVSSVSGGQFELASAPGTALGSFSQAQVQAGQVLFIDDGDGVAPVYALSVSDGGLNSGPQNASINFIPPSLPTPSVTPGAPPPVTGPPVPEPTPPGIDPVTSTDNDDASEDEADTTEEQDTDNADPLVEDLTDTNSDTTDQTPLQDSSNESRNSQAENPVRALLKTMLQRLTALPTLGIPSNLELDTLTQEIRTVLVSEAFNDSLDRMRDDISRETDLHQNIVASSIAVSTSLSAGYVAWLVRGGVLLSSALSSLPAWHFIDPLPVLGTTQNDDPLEGEADESLQKIIETGSSDKAQQSTAPSPATDSESTSGDQSS